MNSQTVPVAAGDRTSIYAKLRITRPELTKQQCRDLAGFSPYTPPCEIEKTKKFIDIRERTLQAADAVGISPETVFTTLKRSMDRSASRIDGSCDATANTAAKTAGEFLGMQAPTQIQTDVTQRTYILAQLLPSLD